MVSSCSKFPISSSKIKPYTLAFYNTEDLYDTKNDPGDGDDAYLPTGAKAWTDTRYKTKLKHIAAVIGGIGGQDGPAVVGLSEVENKKVLQDLINTPPLRKHKYGIIHNDLPNEKTQDVALLYQPRHFKPTGTKTIDSGGKNPTGWAMLQVKGELRGELVTFYVVHWPPAEKNKRGKLNDTAQRKLASVLRQEIKAQQAADLNTKIIVLGDFNAEPRTTVMRDALKANGRPDPSYQEELFNTLYLPYVNGLGSYASRGDFQMPDQILISKSLLNGKPGLQYVRGSAAVYDRNDIKFLYGKYRDTPIRTYSGNLYIGGYSDHFPVFIKVQKDK
ncbi:hypothetical protein MKJ04_16010 [Pontibacter sp. E15-1]|uniref:endonuclease/exonuclease/phosphatase family protein n=1 Tax=Pontibacter sp. E15-1 TaxID=2919918 RepID=UPI001F4F11B3|nr:endonuclease/exonuclease/phosphatase family protein [Pontibacter sp. E15-1]MCJ8166352.1 hypothetical protein [Pontibacter sp. E15-1]